MNILNIFYIFISSANAYGYRDQAQASEQYARAKFRKNGSFIKLQDKSRQGKNKRLIRKLERIYSRNLFR